MICNYNFFLNSGPKNDKIFCNLKFLGGNFNVRTFKVC